MRIPRGLLLLAALLAALAASASPSRVLEARPPKPIADFELTDQNGKLFRLSQLRGSPVLLFFGFTHCPDICPLILGQLQMIAMSPDKAVREARLMMISIDGDRDKPAELKRYLGAVSPDFIGLTGDPGKVREIAAQFPAVFFKSTTPGKAGNSLVEHSPQVYLLDRDGRLRSTFFNASVDALADATRLVASEKR